MTTRQSNPGANQSAGGVGADGDDGASFWVLSSGGFTSLPTGLQDILVSVGDRANVAAAKERVRAAYRAMEEWSAAQDNGNMIPFSPRSAVVTADGQVASVTYEVEHTSEVREPVSHTVTCQ